MRASAVSSGSCAHILKRWDDAFVKKRNPTNVAASVHQRLLNLARGSKQPAEPYSEGTGSREARGNDERLRQGINWS